MATLAGSWPGAEWLEPPGPPRPADVRDQSPGGVNLRGPGLAGVSGQGRRRHNRTSRRPAGGVTRLLPDPVAHGGPAPATSPMRYAELASAGTRKCRRCGRLAQRESALFTGAGDQAGPAACQGRCEKST
jgi:hypothetical protein